MRLSFHGAARGVTGSCHLVESGGYRVLVDCGLFQGSRELHEDNADPFGFDPAAIDCVLLTHAHLDHCGRLPLLAKRGFRGEVIATRATFDLARLVLLDAAHLQEEEARRRARAAMRRGGKDPAAPLYSIVEALDSIGRFGRATDYGKPLDLAPGIRATFVDAGHILGSASILLEAGEKARGHSVLFSGDIGNSGRLLLRAADAPPPAEMVVMETTYGDRLHRPFAQSVEELHAAVGATLARGGHVLIPTFALERAQEIIYVLRQGIEQNRLPPSLPVFLDSPMAISATEVFERYPEYFAPGLADLFRRGQDPFHVPGLRLTRETADSIAINRIAGGAVIMAGSGMCTGGRIRHHLRHNLGRSETSVIFVGYAAAGTLARRIIDGAKEVQLFGEDIPVRARIHTINGFSAHADQRELLAWHDRIAGRQATFLVHGEPAVMEAMASRLDVARIEMPALHQQYDL